MAFPEYVPGGHDSFADMLTEQMRRDDESPPNQQIAKPQQPQPEERTDGGGFRVIARTDEKGRLVPVGVPFLRTASGKREVKIHGPQHLLRGKPNVVFKASNA